MFKKRSSRNLEQVVSPKGRPKSKYSPNKAFKEEDPQTTSPRSPKQKAQDAARARQQRNRKGPKSPVQRGGVSTRALGDTWTEKDNVGVQDFVMLEKYEDESAVLNNLQIR